MFCIAKFEAVDKVKYGQDFTRESISDEQQSKYAQAWDEYVAFSKFTHHIYEFMMKFLSLNLLEC